MKDLFSSLIESQKLENEKLYYPTKAARHESLLSSKDKQQRGLIQMTPDLDNHLPAQHSQMSIFSEFQNYQIKLKKGLSRNNKLGGKTTGNRGKYTETEDKSKIAKQGGLP